MNVHNDTYHLQVPWYRSTRMMYDTFMHTTLPCLPVHPAPVQLQRFTRYVGRQITQISRHFVGSGQRLQPS